MLTSKDTNAYQKVVQKVEAVFAEVLVDAGWILQGAQGQLFDIHLFRLCHHLQVA